MVACQIGEWFEVRQLMVLPPLVLLKHSELRGFWWLAQQNQHWLDLEIFPRVIGSVLKWSVNFLESGVGFIKSDGRLLLISFVKLAIVVWFFMPLPRLNFHSLAFLSRVWVRAASCLALRSMLRLFVSASSASVGVVLTAPVISMRFKR